MIDINRIYEGNARDVLKTFIPGVEQLNYYTFDEFKVLGEKAIVSRTGYTGELGYEIYVPEEPQLVVALGAGIIAWEKYGKKKKN